MDTVWIVEELFAYDSMSIVGVFATEPSAREWIASRPNPHNHFVSEHTVEQ